MAGVEQVQQDAEAALRVARSREIARETPGAARRTRAGPAAEAPSGGGAAELAARTAAVNETLKRLNVAMRFSLEEGNGQVTIQVVDGNTGDVIRTIPPEYFLRATAEPAQGFELKGLAVDEDV